MTELKVSNEVVKIGEIEVKVIEGGFGENSKIVSEIQISKLHLMEVYEVRKSIKRLVDKERLVVNIDYIDLKEGSKEFLNSEIELLLSLGYNKSGITQSSNMFILSESGYKIFLNSLLFDSSIGSSFLNYYFNCSDYTIIKDYNRDELDFFGMLDDVLKSFDITIDKQYRINKFRLDGYIKKLNVVIEYDENNHIGYTQEAHYGRQELIEKELKCKFIRVCNDKSHCENIGIILSNILNLKQNYI